MWPVALVLDSAGLDLIRYLAWVLGRGPASLEIMGPQRKVNTFGVLLARDMAAGLATSLTFYPICPYSLIWERVPLLTYSPREIKHSGLLSFPLSSNITHQVLSSLPPEYLSNMSSLLHPICHGHESGPLSQSYWMWSCHYFCKVPQWLPKPSGHSSYLLAKHLLAHVALCPQALSTLAVQGCTSWNVFALLAFILFYIWFPLFTPLSAFLGPFLSCSLPHRIKCHTAMRVLLL